MSSHMCDHQLCVEVSAVFALLVLISEDSCGTGRKGVSSRHVCWAVARGSVHVCACPVNTVIRFLLSKKASLLSDTLNTHGARSSLPMCFSVS